MKNLFALLTLALLAITAQAQPGVMSFAGPSKFGVSAMNAWQENASDTILFEMTSTSEANITFPSLTYNAMGLTIPSFVIENLKFTYDMATHNATFEEQTFTVTIVVEGEEKVVTGKSFAATYDGANKNFKLNADFSYGRMPVVVTYELNANYVPSATALIAVEAEALVQPTYDLMGRRQNNTRIGQFRVVKGKKCIINN